MIENTVVLEFGEAQDDVSDLGVTDDDFHLRSRLADERRPDQAFECLLLDVQLLEEIFRDFTS